MKLYHQGQRIFGENRVQELVAKQQNLPRDISWHLIGHLQRNKVKAVVPFVDMIHSVDSHRLLLEIERQANIHQRTVSVLLQVKIASEETKFGLDPMLLNEICADQSLISSAAIKICGLMGMASFTGDQQQVRTEFRELVTLFRRLKESTFAGRSEFCEISMGMSSDYLIALEEGSTLVRIGSLLFGSR